MGIRVDQAHPMLSRFSQNNAGIGISLQLITYLIYDQLNNLPAHFDRMLANQRFKKLKITYTGEFDKSKLAIKLVNYWNPSNHSEFFPQIEISNLGLKIKGYLEEKLVLETGIEFSKIIGMVQMIEKCLEIAMFSEEHSDTYFKKIWDHDNQTRIFFENSPYNFSSDDWERLTSVFNGISTNTGPDIAASFISLFSLPDIFKVFHGVTFGENGKLGADDEGQLLMFTAESKMNFETCPTYNATGQTRVTSNVKYISVNGDYREKGGDPEDPSTVIVTAEIDPTSPTLKYPVHGNFENTSSGDIFLYTPIDLLRESFNIVKPSYKETDKGNFGPIFWNYHVVSTPKSIGLQLLNSWPIEFRLSVPSDVSGDAGAGIKIGYITYNAIGTMFNGVVEPFDVNFKIHLDVEARQIVFVSKIENIKGKDFQFKSWPELKFPISEIIDFILARAAEFAITTLAGKVLNVTRIPIADLNILNKFQYTYNALAGETDADGNVTMGVLFKTD